LRKFLQPRIGVVVALDRDEHRQSKADLVLVDQRDLAGDDAFVLYTLDALPARRGGKSNPLADLGHGSRCIFLKHPEDLPVDRIDTTHGFRGDRDDIRHLQNFLPNYLLFAMVIRK
jgi:hypothetical protein